MAGGPITEEDWIGRLLVADYTRGGRGANMPQQSMHRHFWYTAGTTAGSGAGGGSFALNVGAAERPLWQY